METTNGKKTALKNKDKQREKPWENTEKNKENAQKKRIKTKKRKEKQRKTI